MPEVSRSFGVVIAMFYNDHPPPHFHARYGRERAILDIDPARGEKATPEAPKASLVIEWAARHRNELRANWDRARRHAALDPIPPLE